MVLAAKAAVGAKVAVLFGASNTTEPATAALLGPVTVNVELLMVAGAIGSLNTACRLALTRTPVAAASGVVEETVGGVVSAAAPVVKLQV